MRPVEMTAMVRGTFDEPEQPENPEQPKKPGIKKESSQLPLTASDKQTRKKA